MGPAQRGFAMRVIAVVNQKGGCGKTTTTVNLAGCLANDGRRVLVDPRAVVEHHHRGTIAPRIPPALVRAAIEKNRLLYAWKHLESKEHRREHFEALTARVLE